jgi:hypothetical protein
MARVLNAGFCAAENNGAHMLRQAYTYFYKHMQVYAKALQCCKNHLEITKYFFKGLL